MRITCLIDSLGPGGAQRQLCALATMMQRRGAEVTVLTYHPLDFFVPMLQEAGVAHHNVTYSSASGKVLGLRRAIRQERPDVVLAFLYASSMYAELAALPSRQWGLIVSERSLVNPTPRTRARLALHRVADYVTTNSHANRHRIEAIAPWLRKKLVTIYNCVDLDRFRPDPSGADAADQQNGHTKVRLVAVASYHRYKNLAGLIRGIALAERTDGEPRIEADWYGGMPRTRTGDPDTSVFDEGMALINESGLAERVRLHGPIADVTAAYRRADAVVLSSLFEGLPNVVCEAMACGRPVIASRVSDVGRLVDDGQTGFLFNPHDPGDIARALAAFAALSQPERDRMGRMSRDRAVRFFDPSRCGDYYEAALNAAAARQSTELSHWIPDVDPGACGQLQ